MIGRLLFALVLSATAAHAQDFDRTLAVNGQADLTVSTGSGRVQIVPSDDNAIHIHAHLHAGYNESGDIAQRMRRIAEHPPIEQSGSTIRVGDFGSDPALYKNIAIDYQVHVPRSTALNLHSGSGDIEIDNVGRALKADSGSGSVRAHNVSGPADLHSGSGDIELQQTGPGDVHASTGSGSIRVFGLNGGFQAVTGSGDIEAGGHITAPSRLKTGSGSLRLHLGHDARLTLDASTGSGTIRAPGVDSTRHVQQPINGGGPTVELRSGSGDIEVN